MCFLCYPGPVFCFVSFRCVGFSSVQLLGIRWYDRVRNDEVLQRTGLTSLSHLLSRRRISVFRHVSRLDDTPANVDLQLHINVSLNRPPDRTWRRPSPGQVVHGTMAQPVTK